MVSLLKIPPVLLLALPLAAQVLTVPNGGTGKTTLTLHGPLIGNGTGAISSGAAGTAGQCWISGGAGADPSFQACPAAGTVTSFSAGNLSPLFTSSVATATTTPALSFTLSNATASSVFMNPGSSAAAPSYTAVSACGDATHALGWVVGTGFTCQALSGGAGGITSINTDTTAAQTLTAGTGMTVTDTGTGGHTFASAPNHPPAQISGAVTLAVSDFQSCGYKYIASGTFTVTLPISTSQPANGTCVIISNYGTGTITIARNGQNINGGTTNPTLAPAGGGSTLQPNSTLIVSDGTNFFMTRWNASIAFGNVTAGTNTVALVVGAAGSLTATGTGVIDANQVGVAGTAGSGVWNGGVAQGSGLKHQRVTSCSLPATANGTCNTTITWTAAFADANYTAACTTNYTGAAQAFVTNAASKVAATMAVTLMNQPGNSVGGTIEIDCIAMHD
jgi:hypothetical protein